VAICVGDEFDQYESNYVPELQLGFVNSFYGSILFNRIQTNELFVTSYHPVHVNISMSVPCRPILQYTWRLDGYRNDIIFL